MLAQAKHAIGHPLPNLSILHMSDMLRPDEQIVIETLLEEHLATIESALSEARGSSEARRAVLVNCDLGINRSPTLVLAFLVHSNLSLREAYRHVLRTRPGIDPLPGYRQ